MTDNQIKKYLELSDTPTSPMHLEENIMQAIQAYQIKRTKRIQSLRWMLILVVVSISLFIVLFFYGETLFSSLNSIENFPDLSQHMLTIGAGGALFFLLFFIDPILSTYMRRKYERTS